MARSYPAGFDIKQANEFMAELQNESDRGAALIGCDYIDNLMQALIERKMNQAKTTGPGPERISLRLLKYPGPLSTASSRVDLGHVLGWIGPKMYTDLSIIRKVRNKFAHSHRALRFTDGEIGKLCSELNSLRFAAPAQFPRNRDKFLLAVSFLVIQLNRLTGCGDRASLGPDPEVNAIDPRDLANRP